MPQQDLLAFKNRHAAAHGAGQPISARRIVETRVRVCLSVLGLLLLISPGALRAEWKAGVAKVDITPDEPIWMAGYAARTKPSEGVLQRLYAKAVALEDETGKRSILVTADLLGFTRDMWQPISEAVEKRYGVSADRLVLNASHTHSGPVTGQIGRPSYELNAEQADVVHRYTKRVVEQVIELAGRAIERLEPASLSFGQGFAGFAVNRRRVGHREYPGPVDHDVPVLRIQGPDGNLLAVLFGYSCHATVLNDYEINADWPGFAQEAIETAHPSAVAMFVNGCGADQNPLPRRRVELARKYGEILAIAVELVLDAEMKPLSGPLRTALDTVDVRFQEPPSRQEFENIAETNKSYEGRHAEQMLETLEQKGKLPASYPYLAQVWRFGDSLTFISLSGEVVADYSLRFRRKYGWEATWVSGYNNDVFAYIPTARIVREGGYEGATSMINYGHPAPFAESVEETIANKVEELIKQTQ
jgi:hypothetical protein